MKKASNFTEEHILPVSLFEIQTDIYVRMTSGMCFKIL